MLEMKYILACHVLQVSGVKTYGMDKLMAGNTMLNTVLVSTEYYVDQYLPAEEGRSNCCILGTCLLFMNLSAFIYKGPLI